FCVVTIIYTDLYARADMTSKVKPIGNQISIGGVIASALWLLPFIPLLLVRPWWALAIPVAFFTRFKLGRWFRRRLGGYTGDCLGAAQQIMEVLILLTIIATISISAIIAGNPASPFLASIAMFGL
ncbi:MAG: adenosylcobinamide-GDP ribazoletransferase, partial [Coriobacteriia bacterium]|nr:adenosylcobinamide-GDP ribazoletransferase [Coriobacteriia bacterium]